MTRRFVTDEQYGKLWRRLLELARRVNEGTLGYWSTMLALQCLIEGQNEDIYPVTIDYSQSLDDMIKAGKYDCVATSITAENFSINGEGKVERNLVLICFGQPLSNDQVLSELKDHGLEPAQIEDLLALSIKYPEIQRQSIIICPGSILESGANCFVLCLPQDISERGLQLAKLGIDWRSPCRYLARCK